MLGSTGSRAVLPSALSIKERTRSEPSCVATSLNSLARVIYAGGNIAEAELLYRRALKIREATLGAGHVSTGTSLNNLGVLYLSQKKLVEAASLFERALKIAEAGLGRTHPETAKSMNNLAAVYLRAATVRQKISGSRASAHWNRLSRTALNLQTRWNGWRSASNLKNAWISLNRWSRGP
jgi:tetratricopeptide (TPR) repeat protein